jgi:hypothetical protein
MTNGADRFRIGESYTQMFPVSRPPERLHHYTSIAGVKGILDSGRMWATHAGFMNDQREVAYVTDILRDAEEGMPAIRSLSDGETTFLTHLLNAMHPPWWTFAPLVICFCMDGDLLSQWRGYSGPTGETGGYALEFDTPAWVADRYLISQVIYDLEEQRHRMRSAIEIMLEAVRREVTLQDDSSDDFKSLIGAGQSLLWHLFMTFKDKAFSEEKEWRMTFLKNKAPGSWTDFRLGSTLLIPYEKIDLTCISTSVGSLLPLRSVAVGPSAHAELAASSLSMYAQSRGYEATTIVQSTVPLRGRF